MLRKTSHLLLMGLAVAVIPAAVSAQMTKDAKPMDAEAVLRVPAVDYRMQWVQLGAFSVLADKPAEGAKELHSVYTEQKNLEAYLGLDELYIKNDTVNHPTLSFKDRVVAVALTRARELGFETVACASTGNLANSVSAHAAAGSRELPASARPRSHSSSLRQLLSLGARRRLRSPREKSPCGKPRQFGGPRIRLHDGARRAGCPAEPHPSV